MSSPEPSPVESQLSEPPAPRPWPLSPEPEPVFGLRAVVFAFLGLFVAFLLCSQLAMAWAHHLPAFSRTPSKELLLDPRVSLPPQLGGYLALFAGLRLWFGNRGVGMLRALSWRWPPRWLPFLCAGAALGIAVLVGSHWLPTPSDLPIDKMLRTATDAWLMASFGIFIAPFAEEILFRGLLFPALTRRTGPFAALLVTSLLFGAIHAGQLGRALPLIGSIALVGAVLTLVRWRFHSLASSTLVHMGYNGVLFASIFVQTRGFTDLAAK